LPSDGALSGLRIQKSEEEMKLVVRPMRLLAAAGKAMQARVRIACPCFAERNRLYPKSVRDDDIGTDGI